VCFLGWQERPHHELDESFSHWNDSKTFKLAETKHVDVDLVICFLDELLEVHLLGRSFEHEIVLGDSE